MTINPKVSVCMITYGHEKYILQAIEGVLMQECDFDFELIIADDCSPDDTSNIIEEIIKNDPKAIRIKYFKHEKNIGIMSNFLFALKQCKGKYVALCDGDDYWTDPLKLQKQVGFLDCYTDYVIHSGKAQILEKNELKELIGNPLSKNTYELSDFLTKNNLITCSVMFRNSPIKPNCFKNINFGDWMLYVVLLSNHKTSLSYVSDESYAIYRIHSGGAMQALSDNINNYVAHLEQIVAIKKCNNASYNLKDIKQINFYCLSIFRHFFIDKNLLACFKVFIKNFFLVKTKLEMRKYLSFIKHNL